MFLKFLADVQESPALNGFHAVGNERCERGSSVETNAFRESTVRVERYQTARRNSLVGRYFEVEVLPIGGSNAQTHLWGEYCSRLQT
ncbi:hypothetical protein PBY51_006326 [Eleginops maclovinus]|uniref:Uncharacterized protein n=1 Tax=Eleginops maclovinus TaxID=56733 RepID=A0AAN7WWJ8_ELEMC|nr:hypothetical protein PBY51_006326 [Eleginops maclovinus]